MITKATIRAQEKERGFIGKELHDNINQILTATKLYIEMALVEEDIREMLLHKSLENISKAITEIHRLSQSLIPPSLGDIGLCDALSELIANVNISKNLEIKLTNNDFKEDIIDEGIKLMIYRVVQEQLNNIIKHSKAAHAEVGLTVREDTLCVSVMDDGIGFDLAKRKNKGMGLGNIISRAAVHGGSVNIITSPGKGCLLILDILL